MQKGYKRNNKGIAVVRFFCGLIFLAILVFAVYCLLDKFDWSDSMKDPNATTRPYVEITAAPEVTQAPATPTPEPEEPANVVDVTEQKSDATQPESEETQVPAATATVTPTPKPTATATATPTPTPKPTPLATATPEPTAIPESAYCEYMTTGFAVPEAANDAERALTDLYISEPNGGKVIRIAGYGYYDKDTYDAQNASVFLIVTHKASGNKIAYKTASVSGASGISHAYAACQNADMSDFECVLDVSWYGNGEFGLGIVIAYTDENGNMNYSYHEFDDTFTVTDGVATLGSAAPAQDAGAESDDTEETPDFEDDPEEEIEDSGNTVG